MNFCPTFWLLIAVVFWLFHLRQIFSASGLFDFLIIWLSDSLTFWQSDFLTVWLSDSLTFWQSDFLTVRLSDNLTLWQSDFLTIWLSDNLTFWQSDFLTFWHCEIMRFWQSDSMTIWHSYFLTLWDYEILTVWHSDNLTFWHLTFWLSYSENCDFWHFTVDFFLLLIKNFINLYFRPAIGTEFFASNYLFFLQSRGFGGFELKFGFYGVLIEAKSEFLISHSFTLENK